MTVADILLAKLLAVLIVATLVVLPLFALDAVVLILLRVIDLSEAAQLLVVLFSALTYAVGEALLLALLARDLRTAQNLNGALLVPVTVLAGAVLLAVPSPLEFAAVSALLLVGAWLCLTVGVRWLTFERYLL